MTKAPVSSVKGFRTIIAVSLLTVLAACGSPNSLSQRPRGDDNSCQRVDGTTRCSDFIPASRDPAQRQPF